MRGIKGLRARLSVFGGETFRVHTSARSIAGQIHYPI